nr:ankyrin repeat-containing protein ITN1-like [Malus domestica]
MACGIGPEVLNQNNYTPWSMRIKTYLVAKDLWDVVQTEHPEVGPSDKHKVWKQRNAQALHAIQLSCGDDILSFISDATSAKSAWDILLDKFEIHRRFFKGNGSSKGEDVGGSQRSMKKLTSLRSIVIGTPVELKSPTDDKTRHGVDDSYLGPLFSDVWRGDWKAAKAFLDQNPEAIGKVYSKDGGTIIHSAILFKRFDIVKELLQWMREEDLAITDQHGCTPLIYAINQGSIEIVENMIEMNKNIAAMRIPPDNMTPVLYAFSLGFNEIARKLYKVTPPEELTCGPNEGRDGAELISSCFYAQSFGTYINVGLFRGLAKNLLKLLGVKRMYEMKLVHDRTREFLCLMSRHITCVTAKQYSFLQTAIFRAMEQGLVEFIDHLFEANPGLEIQDGKGKAVLEYAVECRQAKIYNLLYGMLRESDRTWALSCNSILHSAANLSGNLNHIQGAALQMQSELQWFKEVESIVPIIVPGLINYTDRMTARALFTKNHKELVEEGAKSMKATATSCTVVGALIVTMMFAASFTVPGGSTQDKGYPTFLGKKLFMVFIMSDSISLFFSTTSVMIFLGLLTSRYSEEYFLVSLPTKMILGLFTLFFSIAAMMMAFSSALILMLDKQSWIVIPVILLATLPIASFVWMQFPLLRA